METVYIKTPIGIAQICGNKDGISAITFLNEEQKPCLAIPKILEEAVLQLNEYFNGDRTEFTLKLNPQGTTFQKEVWHQLQSIPFGKTCSYMDMAKKKGNPKAIRAMASANGKNPIAIVIPCHRVIGSNGSLTGYAGGLWRKKFLLELEQGNKQLDMFN